MANDDKNLNIAINLATHKTGPDAAKEIKALTDETKRYEAALKRMAEADTSSTDALRKLIEERKKAKAATEEQTKANNAALASFDEKHFGKATKATEAATSATNKWKSAARGLAFEYPVLGRLASLALNPIAISAAAITGAISKANQITRTWGEQLKSSAAAAAIPISTLAQQFREMESDRTKANAAFQTTLTNIGTFADHAITKMEAIKTATEKALDAQEKFELATEKDPARQADIQFAFAARRSMNSQAAEAAIQQRREQQLQGLDTEAAKQRDIFAGLAKGRSREAIEAELRDGGAGLAARRAAEEKEVTDLRAAVLDSHAVPGTFGKLSLMPDAMLEAIKTGGIGDIQKELRLTGSVMPGGDAQIQALLTTMQTVEKTKGAEKDFAARRPGMEMASAAYTAMDSAVTRRDTLEGEIVRSRDISAATAPFRTQAAIAESAAAAAGRGQGGAARMVMGAAAGADAVLAGGKASPDQAAMIQALTQMLGLQGQSQQTILEMFSKMNDRLRNFDKALETISSRAANNRRFE